MNYRTLTFAVATLFAGVSFSMADSGVPKTYPLKTCVISGEALGEHGKPVKLTSNGTDVYLCCKSCTKDFNKDPEKYVKQVKNAEAKK